MFHLVSFFGCLCLAVAAHVPSAEITIPISSRASDSKFSGSVYVMSNDVRQNTIIAYGRLANGTLELIGEFKTGGRGGDLDDEDDGVDPLFSSFSVILTPDHRFLLAVNAGSSSISVFRVNSDFTLVRTSVQKVNGFGPNSLTFSNGLVYVSVIDSDRSFSSLADVKGGLEGFRLTRNGKLLRIPKSTRDLPARPAAVRLSPDSKFLIVSFVFAGMGGASAPLSDEILVFRVFKDGRLSGTSITSATSTEVNNPEGRNLPTALGFEIVETDGTQYVVVAEARLIGPDGGAGDAQTSSVSIWKLSKLGQLIPSQLDILVGSSVTSGQRASCWVRFSKDLKFFWTTNTLSEALSAFSFIDGQATLVEEQASSALFPTDLWSSYDGKFVYALSLGFFGVYEVENGGTGSGLTLIQSPSNIPETNAQGIVAI